MAKILLTGGTGYIASHTAVNLLNNGDEVLLVDNLINSTEDTVARISALTGKNPVFYCIDLRDQDAVDEFFQTHQDIDVVIHFAGLKANGESILKPLLYYHNNLLSALNVLQSMEKYGVKNFIFSSSACVYGSPRFLPITENHPLTDSASPYGKSKKIIEDITRHKTETNNGFKAVILRYFNAYGAHESGRLGELPQYEPANLMPKLLQTVSGQYDTLYVFGDDYQTKDGTPVRDYVHVMDLADAHIAAMRRLLSGKMKDNHEVYNLGTGAGYSVLEMIKLFEQVTGRKVNYQIVDRRPGDLDSVYANPEAAREKLDWQARRDLREGIRASWEWEKHLRGIE